jgi:toxin ParE1/3/4
MSKYRLSALARTDLEEIWSYVAQHASYDAADRLIDSITDRFPVLARMPAAGRVRDDIEAGVRSFAVGGYLIFYRKGKRGGIVVARVLHGARDQKRAWEKEGA